MTAGNLEEETGESSEREKDQKGRSGKERSGTRLDCTGCGALLYGGIKGPNENLRK